MKKCGLALISTTICPIATHVWNSAPESRYQYKTTSHYIWLIRLISGTDSVISLVYKMSS